jgi:hypothetical protein
MRIETHNLDGSCPKRTQVYDMTPAAADPKFPEFREYWPAVTDVPCPVCDVGYIRWAEAGYAPGYRICDGCGRHFLAAGTATAPTLLRFRSRRSRVSTHQER